MSEDREKIGAEELQCKEMAENAQRDLDEALPALEEALKVTLCHQRLAIFLHCYIFNGYSFFFWYVGSGIPEQKGHDRDQVVWSTTSSGGDGDAGCHDPSGERSILGRGQEAVG